MCLAMAVLAAVLVASVSGAGHWTVTHRETVERAVRPQDLAAIIAITLS